MKNDSLYAKRKISFCIFAAVYQEYYETHFLPDGVDMKFKVPQRDFIEAALLVNKLLEENIKPLCRRASRHLHHSRLVAGMFFHWMHKNFRYITPFPIICTSSIISHFVLHYFDIGCYRFSLFAAEFLTEILKNSYPETMQSFIYAPFGGVRTFCDLLEASVEFGNISSWKLKGKNYNVTFDFERFPKDLLRVEILPPEDDTSEDDHSEPEHRSPKHRAANPLSPKQNKSNIISPIKSPKSSKSTDPKISKSAKKSRDHFRRKGVCKRCKMDCREYLKRFVYEFKCMNR